MIYSETRGLYKQAYIRTRKSGYISPPGRHEELTYRITPQSREAYR